MFEPAVLLAEKLFPTKGPVTVVKSKFFPCRLADPRHVGCYNSSRFRKWDGSDRFPWPGTVDDRGSSVIRHRQLVDGNIIGFIEPRKNFARTNEVRSGLSVKSICFNRGPISFPGLNSGI